MKRLLILLMAFGLIAAACGDSDDDGGSTATDTEADAPAADADADADAPAEDEGTDADAPAEDDAAGSGETPDELNVAYFQEWPTANQVAQENDTYDDVLGIPVNWVPLPTGNDMATAMEAGDVDISYSQGLTPFANFVTGGGDLTIVGVAVSYADADNCVATEAAGITAENAAETIPGVTIATPLGNVTHFKLLKMLEHLNVDTSSVELVASEGGQAAVATFESGDAAIVCAFGGAVNEMLAAGGNVILTGQEQEDIGIRVFDIISVTNEFAEKYPDVVTQFLQVTEDANKAYNQNPEEALDTISTASGMDLAATEELIAAFKFIEKPVQLSQQWLGGTVQDVMKEQMDFFVQEGEIDSSLESYDEFVDTSYLEKVN